MSGVIKEGYLIKEGLLSYVLLSKEFIFQRRHNQNMEKALFRAQRSW
jgi:hypothetical protein